MDTIAVCLYSKYSQRCKEFMEDLVPGAHMLCVDHIKVRQAIMNDNHGYNIKTVPCVFLFYPNGKLEKYEGSDAFTWLRQVKNVMMVQQEPQSFNQPPQHTILQEPQSFNQPPPQPQHTILQEPFNNQPPPQPQQHTTLQEPPSFNQQQEPLDITPIGENELQPQNAEEIINKEMEMRMASEQIMTRKQENIKELAQLMQRQRESDDDQIEPPPLYPKDRLGGSP